ncbi:MAG: Unknown protein [uncultured Aureispira sp.]|uniref:Alkyl hydroperoxide reductase subunit C/ Thiol specific antioxidant domain-containing protein n=1 Tax=uncultured Aureispira sp. TaxID=1331704 RepID=A0A6S6SL95_9BACT|nr:MAG: Unknown protein [uncultured Aureispira sp.]
MKYRHYILLLFLTLSSCDSSSNKKITFEDIKESNIRTGPTFSEENITFYDTNYKKISSEKFNQLLAEGLYLSEGTQKADGSEVIHLTSIKEHVKKLEAQSLPSFELLNLTGKKYNHQSLKGKITILSFWFTASHICVTDILDLNNLAQKYSAKEDCIWLAPALDNTTNLSRFLRGKNWYLEFAADQEKLALKFGILTYPTHLVIDQQGSILKAVVRPQETIETLNQILKTIIPS